MSYLALAQKWLAAAHEAPNLETALDLVARAQRALGRIDADDVYRFLVEERCQYRPSRAVARCGQPAAIIDDEVGGCCAAHTCALCGRRGIHPYSERGNECASCELAWQEREAQLAEEEAGYRVGRGAASDRESY